MCAGHTANRREKGVKNLKSCFFSQITINVKSFGKDKGTFLESKGFF